MRDKHGISRITYVDVSANNPGNVIDISDRPVLDIGKAGCFDDNGMILGDIIRVKNQLYMYYVGFQHVDRVKFYAFSGLAISNDNGESFERYSQVPILDRTNQGRFGRCIHTVLEEDGIFKCYYAVINDWKLINGTAYPVYNIWLTTSKNGIDFERQDNQLCVDVEGEEYRIGRPKVYKCDGGYEMYYTRDTVKKEYLAGYAVSKDGMNWVRKDEAVGITKSDNGWDSEMACYPVKLKMQDKQYLFYNGNGMGKTGVGYAVLE